MPDGHPRSPPADEPLSNSILEARTRVMKKIVLILPWFGPWPPWMSLFLESCRWNPTVDFVLISDADIPEDLPPNVLLRPRTFADHKSHIVESLRLRPKWNSPYKLVDFKPVLGYLFPELIEGYDYWGYGDIDVIYGNIRRIFTDEYLDHDVISTHRDIVSGHLALVRNDGKLHKAFRRVLHWRYFLQAARHMSFDERIFSMLFIGDALRKSRGIHRFLVPKIGGAKFDEQFSTSIQGLPWIDGSTAYPKEWYWRKGRLTADNAGDREFLYLHFTHWASSRWGRGNNAAWEGIDPLVRVSDPGGRGFKVSAAGFGDP